MFDYFVTGAICDACSAPLSVHNLRDPSMISHLRLFWDVTSVFLVAYGAGSRRKSSSEVGSLTYDTQRISDTHRSRLKKHECANTRTHVALTDLTVLSNQGNTRDFLARTLNRLFLRCCKIYRYETRSEKSLIIRLLLCSSVHALY